MNGWARLACKVGVCTLCQSCCVTEHDNVLVAVGNIPYDATEEQLRAICEQVGPVVSFRYAVLDSIGVAGIESGVSRLCSHIVFTLYTINSIIAASILITELYFVCICLVLWLVVCIRFPLVALLQSPS